MTMSDWLSPNPPRIADPLPIIKEKFICMLFAYINNIAYLSIVKLRIIKWKYILDHCANDRKMLLAFKRFLEIAKSSVWRKPQDVIKTFKNADLVTCKKQNTSRLIFNIGHNEYRLVTGYYFANDQTFLYVKFVGSHKEYDKIDACKVDIFKSRKR